MRTTWFSYLFLTFILFIQIVEVRGEKKSQGDVLFFSKHNLFQVLKFKYKYPALPPRCSFSPFGRDTRCSKMPFPAPTPVESYFTTVLLAKWKADVSVQCVVMQLKPKAVSTVSLAYKVATHTFLITSNFLPETVQPLRVKKYHCGIKHSCFIPRSSEKYDIQWCLKTSIVQYILHIIQSGAQVTIFFKTGWSCQLNLALFFIHLSQKVW